MLKGWSNVHTTPMGFVKALKDQAETKVCMVYCVEQHKIHLSGPDIDASYNRKVYDIMMVSK